MFHSSRLCAAALLAAALGGCQALSGSGGVMPDTEVGPPPSARADVPGRQARVRNVDADGEPLQTSPTRRLDLPTNARGEARTADSGPRRIRREEIDETAGSSRSSGGLAPQMSAGGNVGMGGKF